MEHLIGFQKLEIARKPQLLPLTLCEFMFLLLQINKAYVKGYITSWNCLISIVRNKIVFLMCFLFRFSVYGLQFGLNPWLKIKH